jgi:DNA-binding CsgD family transcriptional regulator
MALGARCTPSFQASDLVGFRRSVLNSEHSPLQAQCCLVKFFLSHWTLKLKEPPINACEPHYWPAFAISFLFGYWNIVHRDARLNLDCGYFVPHMENLTPRELQVAQLVSSGLSNQEISDRLRISLQTVKNHMQAIYKKLGVKNRVELSLHFSEARKRSVHSGLRSKA